MSVLTNHLAVALTIGAIATLTPATSAAQLGRHQGLVEPNVAADSTLLKLPYMNAAIVQAIKDARPILSIVTLDSLLAGKSLTKAQRDSLYRHLFVHVDLNRGTDAEFLLIPGAGQRMLREFKEYRPWTSFEQFRREIGKYFPSNPDEVTRLEQYVFIPVDLNTATDSLFATFAPIGVGTARWIREFKEYRPWTSEEQFQRNIGKYVRNNPKEVNRLWRYMIIK
jgi:DNA uptake protein ComE-like DNA-binding protein